MDTPAAIFLLGLNSIFLGVIVLGGWNLIDFIKNQLSDNIKEHSTFMKNVVHTVETRKIVDQHTHEIKCLDDRVQENTSDIKEIKKIRYKKIN